MKKVFSILTLLVICASCSNPPSEAEQEFNDLREKVFAEHDKVMEDMPTINNLIQKIEPKIDSTEQGIDYKRATQRLKNAHNFMMTWMRSFSKDFPDINDKEKDYSDEEYRERTKRLKGHEKIMYKVERDVNKSISYAELVLKRGK